MFYQRTVLLVANYVFILFCVDGFNLSPQPNYIFKEPNKAKTRIKFNPKIRSSYFGYSINLRSNGVMVGAPRAQPSLESQRHLNESGAIYKCSFNSLNCEIFIVDKNGDVTAENTKYELNSEYKNFQWLGASMDGNFLDENRFVVCAPRIMSWWPYGDYCMHGLCYLTSNTSTYAHGDAQKLAPFRIAGAQLRDDGHQLKYLYMLSEEGISVHITENDEEILIGAPGVSEWRGTIVRYQKKGNAKVWQNLQVKNDFYLNIPNPIRWGQDEHSYFGYAITSGYFSGLRSKKIFYVASAPQANMQDGEVYIFEIEDIKKSTETKIKKYRTFAAHQMGEYFGYALTADDFNGDGFYDLAICAPLYGKENSYDNGAVYIYQNLGESSPGKWSSNFVLQSVLKSDYASSGRFGSSIARLGDINLDGYKDIAIGAPYEDDGAVYLYFGGRHGIIQKPSQKLTAPKLSNVAPFTPQMFGNALSKGVDIDQNHYLDLAVGAPNAETVYVYRSYPVVQIHGNVYSRTSKLDIKDKWLKFSVCWSMKSSVLKETRINILIKVDEKFQRVKFPDGKNQIKFVTPANWTQQCRQYNTSVKFISAHVYKSIDIEMYYDVVDKVPDNGVFCSKCVAVNPFESKVAQSKVVFFTGCGNTKCVADLKLSSEVLNPLPYQLGNTSIMTIAYTVENFGETAYLAQINVTISDLVSFMKIPSNCELYRKQQMLCNVNNGSPLNRGELGYLNVSLDTTKLLGVELLVKASVNSTGDERNDEDNYANIVIPLSEFSKVEILGKSDKPLLILEDGSEFENVSYTYEITNHGPSNLEHIDIIVSIPIFYQNNLTMVRFDVISTENISLKSMYDYQQFGIDWDTLQNSTDDPSIHQSDAASQILVDKNPQPNRRNASENQENTDLPNEYTSFSDHVDVNLKGLQADRTLSFDCNDSTTIHCVKAKFSVNNFQVGDTPILIELKLSLNLHAIDQIFSKSIDWFVVRPSIELRRKADEDGTKMRVRNVSYAYTLIWKRGTIEFWVYILAALLGLLTLILLSFGLFRLGFFRRAKKEELKILVRQSQMQAQQSLGVDYEDN